MRMIYQIKILLLILLLFSINCASLGLIAEKYPPEFFHIPNILPDDLADKQQVKFIFYGDSRQGWRIYQKFIRPENWLTWKMALFPFYQLYLLGNGIRGGVNYLRQTPDYGAKTRRQIRDAIFAEANRSNIDFIFHSGDFVTNGRCPDHWAEFIRENKIDVPLVTTIPFLPIAGNHEYTTDEIYGLPNYNAIFDCPQFYTLELANATIFVIDSDIIVDQYQNINDSKQDSLFEQWIVAAPGANKPGWLEKQLNLSRKKFKILCIHHPPVSFNEHHADWLNPRYGKQLQAKRKQLLELLARFGVQIIFSGHEHLYEHDIIKIPDRQNQTETKIHLVISGGGGAPLRNEATEKELSRYHRNYQQEGLAVQLMKQESQFHYCLTTVGPDRIKIAVISVPENPQKTARVIEEIVVVTR